MKVGVHYPGRSLNLSWTIQDSNPTRKRKEVLDREITRQQKGIERLLNAYQEGLLELDELRSRLPTLRKKSEALRSELRSLEATAADRQTFLRLADNIGNFLERLRSTADTLDVIERQKILRLVVKEILIHKETIKIRHSIPITGTAAHSGGSARGGHLSFAFGESCRLYCRTSSWMNSTVSLREEAVPFADMPMTVTSMSNRKGGSESA